jgi:hypothetical protein
MYGEVKPWGCRWFELWRRHVDEAVAKGQQLQVYYFNGRIGAGKVESWAACKDDAIKRDKLWSSRQAFLRGLPAEEKAWLDELSSTPRDDSKGEVPGSERGDEEELLFMASLPEEERRFPEGHKGLGNSQKAEVAWLEKMGYAYEELEVADFVAQTQTS